MLDTDNGLDIFADNDEAFKARRDNLITGPRGGRYYIAANGEHVYVDENNVPTGRRISAAEDVSPVPNRRAQVKALLDRWLSLVDNMRERLMAGLLDTEELQVNLDNMKSIQGELNWSTEGLNLYHNAGPRRRQAILEEKYPEETPVATPAPAPVPAPPPAPRPAPRSAAPRDPRIPAPGNTITRHMRNGPDAVVTVTEDGFVWNGQTYQSLGAISEQLSGAYRPLSWWGLGAGPTTVAEPVAAPHIREQLANVRRDLRADVLPVGPRLTLAEKRAALIGINPGGGDIAWDAEIEAAQARAREISQSRETDRRKADLQVALLEFRRRLSDHLRANPGEAQTMLDTSANSIEAMQAGGNARKWVLDAVAQNFTLDQSVGPDDMAAIMEDLNNKRQRLRTQIDTVLSGVGDPVDEMARLKVENMRVEVLEAWKDGMDRVYRQQLGWERMILQRRNDLMGRGPDYIRDQLDTARAQLRADLEEIRQSTPPTDRVGSELWTARSALINDTITDVMAGPLNRDISDSAAKKISNIAERMRANPSMQLARDQDEIQELAKSGDASTLKTLTPEPRNTLLGLIPPPLPMNAPADVRRRAIDTFMNDRGKAMAEIERTALDTRPGTFARVVTKHEADVATGDYIAVNRAMQLTQQRWMETEHSDPPAPEAVREAAMLNYLNMSMRLGWADVRMHTLNAIYSEQTRPTVLSDVEHNSDRQTLTRQRDDMRRKVLDLQMTTLRLPVTDRQRRELIGQMDRLNAHAGMLDTAIEHVRDRPETPAAPVFTTSNPTSGLFGTFSSVRDPRLAPDLYNAIGQRIRSIPELSHGAHISRIITSLDGAAGSAMARAVMQVVLGADNMNAYNRNPDQIRTRVTEALQSGRLDPILAHAIWDPRQSQGPGISMTANDVRLIQTRRIQDAAQALVAENTPDPTPTPVTSVPPAPATPPRPLRRLNSPEEASRHAQRILEVDDDLSEVTNRSGRRALTERRAQLVAELNAAGYDERGRPQQATPPPAPAPVAPPTGPVSSAMVTTARQRVADLERIYAQAERAHDSAYLRDRNSQEFRDSRAAMDAASARLTQAYNDLSSLQARRRETLATERAASTRVERSTTPAGNRVFQGVAQVATPAAPAPRTPLYSVRLEGEERYISTHGHAPRGRGMWRFKIGNEEMDAPPNLTYADAVKYARRYAAARGETSITVMT